MREYLRGVVQRGTGQAAKLDLISVGGKTGTSQKLVDGKYSKSLYNSSFIGFFPVENPQVICLILVNSPEKGKYGGMVAAPIFKEIAGRIVNSDIKFFQSKQNSNPVKAEIKNSVSSNNNGQKIPVMSVSNPGKIKINNDYALKHNMIPDLSKYSLRDAIDILTKMGVKYKVTGSGFVVSQSLTPGEKVQKGLPCILSCEETKLNGAVVY